MKNLITTELRKGPWTAEEDSKLIFSVAAHGEGRWDSLALLAGVRRSGKSCRLRWRNNLRPDLRRDNFTLDEQLHILRLYLRWGNSWSKIAEQLPGRTDNEVKNYWRTKVLKLARHFQCHVSSPQFRDALCHIWIPRLIEQIHANNATLSQLSPGTKSPILPNFGPESDASFSISSSETSSMFDTNCVQVPVNGPLGPCPTSNPSPVSSSETHTAAASDPSDNWEQLINDLISEID